MIAFPHILNSESKAKQGHLLKVSQLMTIELGFYQSVSRAHVLATNLNCLLSGMISKTLSRFTMAPLLLSHGEHFHLAPSKTMLTGHFLDRTEECSLFSPSAPCVDQRGNWCRFGHQAELEPQPHTSPAAQQSGQVRSDLEPWLRCRLR